jgi:tryptophan halogenase
MSAPATLLVAGRDAPLWLAVNVLHAALSPAGVTVAAVELPAQQRADDVYVTLPALEALHNLLGLEEAKVLQATGGAFSLGQMFAGFSGGRPPFMHAYGTYGATIEGQGFFSFWLKARSLGLNVELEDFSLTAAAAKQGRVFIPDATTEAFGRTDYGYHLPAAAYTALLKARAVEAGVTVHEARGFGVLPGGDGIAALDLGGRKVSADLYVDTTGAMMDALNVGTMSWRTWFPCDRLLAVAGPRLKSLPSYAQVRAQSDGWLAFHPSQRGTHLLRAYDSARLSDDEALHAAAAVSGLVLGDAVVSANEPGRRERLWAGNCVAIGEAACRFDAIDSVELQAVQTGLVHLLSLFPVDEAPAAERQEYDRVAGRAFERLRDFQAAHYLLNRYGRPDFWAQARAVEPPPELKSKIAAFSARGTIAWLDDEAFSEDSWRALFVGHGLVPDSYDPRIDRVDPLVIKRDLRGLLSFIKDQVTEQASHESYIELFCAAEEQ